MTKAKAEERLKLLALDLETAPWLAYGFGGLYNVNIGHTQVKEWGRIICFSAQWEGKKGVIFKSEYHDGPEEMFRTLYDLLLEADAVLTYNGDGFDLPWLSGELQLNGFTALPPIPSIDLYKHFKKTSRFASKKLDVMSHRFLFQRKVSHDGFILWYNCVDPDVDQEVKRKAWAKMRTYAKKDTALLFPLFESIKSWVKLPVPLVVSDDGEPRCRFGHTNIQLRGESKTQRMTYQRFQCNECGAWGKFAKALHNNGPTTQI